MPTVYRSNQVASAHKFTGNYSSCKLKKKCNSNDIKLQYSLCDNYIQYAILFFIYYTFFHESGVALKLANKGYHLKSKLSDQEKGCFASHN